MGRERDKGRTYPWVRIGHYGSLDAPSLQLLHWHCQLWTYKSRSKRPGPP